MNSYRFAALTYATFQPIDLEKITGMKPALIRDWRRRDLIHESLDRSDVGFSAATAAELLLLARLSDHGIGPKRVYGWTRAFSGIILHHALDDASAWQSQEAWEAWKDDQGSGKAPDRYLAVYPAPHGLRSMDSLQNVMSPSSEIVTIVNMKALGEHLRTSAGQPLADVTWSYGMETE